MGQGPRPRYLGWTPTAIRMGGIPGGSRGGAGGRSSSSSGGAEYRGQASGPGPRGSSGPCPPPHPRRVPRVRWGERHGWVAQHPPFPVRSTTTTTPVGTLAGPLALRRWPYAGPRAQGAGTRPRPVGGAHTAKGPPPSSPPSPASPPSPPLPPVISRRWGAPARAAPPPDSEYLERVPSSDTLWLRCPPPPTGH